LTGFTGFKGLKDEILFWPDAKTKGYHLLRIKKSALLSSGDGIRMSWLPASACLSC